jgi:sulfur-oxidizing protein SoxY
MKPIKEHSMTHLSRRSILLGFLALALPVVPGLAQAPVQEDPWPGLVTDVFNDRPMEKTDTVIAMEAPYRAQDAALTPLTLHINSLAVDPVKLVTLVIDHNPAPVAAVFKLGEKAQVSRIETRVRVNQNTAIHAVAETAAGKLYVTEKFVKAAGGCAAPSMKNADEAKANLGKMKLRQFPVPANDVSGIREAQLMIRHPNNSGFQVDQITHYYIPARFVNDIKLWQGGDLVLGVEGGISISEDPNFRFTFRGNGAKELKAKIVDTDQAAFERSWDAIAPGAPGT